MTAVGEVFSRALDALEEIVPMSRSRVRMVDTLQEACHLAKRAVALRADYQEGYQVWLEVGAYVKTADSDRVGVIVGRFGASWVDISFGADLPERRLHVDALVPA